MTQLKVCTQLESDFLAWLCAHKKCYNLIVFTLYNNNLDNFSVAPGDYLSNSATLTFTQTQTRLSFDVAIVDDNIVEARERFFATAELISTDAAGITIAPESTTVDILDNDSKADYHDILSS